MEPLARAITIKQTLLNFHDKNQITSLQLGEASVKPIKPNFF